MSVPPTPLLLERSAAHKALQAWARFSGADTILLKDTSYGIFIICFLLGFQNSLRFIKLFLLSLFYFGAEDHTRSLAQAKHTVNNQAQHPTPSCCFQPG